MSNEQFPNTVSTYAPTTFAHAETLTVPFGSVEGTYAPAPSPLACAIVYTALVTTPAAVVSVTTIPPAVKLPATRVNVALPALIVTTSPTL